MPIILEKSHLNEIQRHGEATYPHECCGFLLGRANDNRRIVQQMPLAAQNQRSDAPHNRYQISPQEYLRAERLAAEAGLEILGFYHSHPDHPARPSQFDLENAWPSLIYVIVGVNGGQADKMTAWRLADDRSRFLPEAILTQPASPALENLQF
jgi:proteasome lid subunit RPN8/RPN11